MRFLTDQQARVLKLFGQSKLKSKFYWTGGTLLSHHYLQHRFSEDLDFFTKQKFNFEEVNSWIQKLKLKEEFREIKSQKIFDRWEFICKKDNFLRIEFVYYNDEKKELGKKQKLWGLKIDSLKDIAANKTMAHMDRDEPKDLFDLYFLIKQKDFTPKKLLSLVKQKFGVEFDESLFWSEAFKTLPLLKSLEPFVVQKNKKKLIREVTTYFKKNSNKYLGRQF